MSQLAPDESERVRHLLKILFAGNQSQMAAEIGVAQPVISRVVTGKHGPGKRLLAALAAHPKVNPAWLATGEGAPLLSARSPSDSGGWPVPFATSLLPGPPRVYRQMLTSHVQYVPGVLYRESIYAIRARACLSEELAQQLHILPDDTLIFETDASAWRHNVQLLHAKLCALQIKASDAEQIVLRQVFINGPSVAIQCTAADDIRERQTEASEARLQRERHGKERRAIILRDEQVDGTTPPTMSLVSLGQVVGLCVELIRVF